MTFLYQSLVLIISFSLIYAFQDASLFVYTIPVIGLLVLVYLILFARQKNFSFLTSGGGLLQIFTLNTLVLLLIFSTDGFNSPIFFLLYFLSFGIAFAFNPASILVYIVGVILVFLPIALKDNVTDNFIKLGVLALVSPLAFFFAQMYQKTEEQEEKIEEIKERAQDAASTITSDVEKLLGNEKEILKEEDMEKLNEILEEAEDLRQEAK
ncbi:hypothetical protein KKG52_01135 [Patescibacteria group bacterium]|nr:hypothetical protein [Patescibacteria group bacterium]